MFIKRRVCDALIQTAEPHAVLKFLLKGTKANIVVGVVKRLGGGLWVGGNVYLYRDAVQFRPNGLNKLIHTGELSWRVPLEEIASISVGSGFVTKVITIRTEKVNFKIRCYGANGFARMIDDRSPGRRGIRDAGYMGGGHRGKK